MHKKQDFRFNLEKIPRNDDRIVEARKRREKRTKRINLFWNIGQISLMAVALLMGLFITYAFFDCTWSILFKLAN